MFKIKIEEEKKINSKIQIFFLCLWVRIKILCHSYKGAKKKKKKKLDKSSKIIFKNWLINIKIIRLRTVELINIYIYYLST